MRQFAHLLFVIILVAPHCAVAASNLGSPVNTPATETSPFLSADGLSLYFSSDQGVTVGQRDLFVANRATTADPWGTPATMGAVVNSGSDEGAPDISADGLTLYFDSGRLGGQGELDIWFSTRATLVDPWSAPSNLGAAVNSASVDSSASISPDGLSLFFYSTRAGGLGSGDLWVAMRPTTASPWEAPVNLGGDINGASDDRDPAISPDGLTLLFASDRDGSFDIWRTDRATASDPWGAPVKLGPNVNSSANDFDPTFAIGDQILFGSNRAGSFGNADLWSASLVPEPTGMAAMGILLATGLLWRRQSR